MIEEGCGKGDGLVVVPSVGLEEGEIRRVDSGNRLLFWMMIIQ